VLGSILLYTLAFYNDMKLKGVWITIPIIYGVFNLGQLFILIIYDWEVVAKEI